MVQDIRLLSFDRNIWETEDDICEVRRTSG